MRSSTEVSEWNEKDLWLSLSMLNFEVEVAAFVREKKHSMKKKEKKSQD